MPDDVQSLSNRVVSFASTVSLRNRNVKGKKKTCQIGVENKKVSLVMMIIV